MIEKGLKSSWGKQVGGYDPHFKDNKIKVQAAIDEQNLGDEYEIVLPNTNQLQIDYDVKELPEVFEKVLDILTQATCKLNDCLIYRVTKSRNDNLHVVIDLPAAISDTERIAWQAIFGSDSTREALSLMSVRREIANPTLLIERRNATPIMTGAKMLEPPKGRKFRDTSTASD